jgi:hypothetical protein
MMGGLATYELFAGYQKLVGKMFGSYIEFKWKPSIQLHLLMSRNLFSQKILMAYIIAMGQNYI